MGYIQSVKVACRRPVKPALFRHAGQVFTSILPRSNKDGQAIAVDSIQMQSTQVQSRVVCALDSGHVRYRYRTSTIRNEFLHNSAHTSLVSLYSNRCENVRTAQYTLLPMC